MAGVGDWACSMVLLAGMGSPRIVVDFRQTSASRARRQEAAGTVGCRVATTGDATSSAGPPPPHEGFQFSPGAPIRFGRGRPDGAVAAQTPFKDGHGSYQLAYKERDRYLRILEAYTALREAVEQSDGSSLLLEP